jgi:hypothetical protein
MDILNKLEIYTRHVIQNTSIQRLHKRSWVQSDIISQKVEVSSRMTSLDVMSRPAVHIILDVLQCLGHPINDYKRTRHTEKPETLGPMVDGIQVIQKRTILRGT